MTTNIQFFLLVNFAPHFYMNIIFYHYIILFLLFNTHREILIVDLLLKISKQSESQFVRSESFQFHRQINIFLMISCSCCESNSTAATDSKSNITFEHEYQLHNAYYIVRHHFTNSNQDNLQMKIYAKQIIPASVVRL